MVTKYHRISFLIGTSGIVLQAVGVVIIVASQNVFYELTSCLIVLYGVAILMRGLAYYAKAKGQSTTWCLMALLPLIGLFVIALLRDRTNQTKLIGKFP